MSQRCQNAIAANTGRPMTIDLHCKLQTNVARLPLLFPILQLQRAQVLLSQATWLSLRCDTMPSSSKGLDTISQYSCKGLKGGSTESTRVPQCGFPLTSSATACQVIVECPLVRLTPVTMLSRACFDLHDFLGLRFMQFCAHSGLSTALLKGAHSSFSLFSSKPPPCFQILPHIHSCY